MARHPDPHPRPHPLRRRVTHLLLAALTAGAALTGLHAGTASAAGTCDRWAASTGNDANDGTAPARAFASLGTLAAALAPGQIGCIPAGDTFVAHGAGVIGTGQGTAAQPITITSGPGGRATIRGGILFNARSHDIVFRDLAVVGDGFTTNAIQIEGRSIRLTGVDVSHPIGICIGVGTLSAYQHAYSGIEATGVVIEQSRIHGCGTDPSMAPRWADDRFSGSHGIYIVNATGTRIVDNAIHDNQYRGLQLFPYARGTVVERNVFDHNATHVNIGSTLVDGFPWRSSGTVVRDNVMSNRVTDFRTDKNPGQVHGYFPAGADPMGNVVAGNCMVDEPGAEVTGFGVTFGVNTLAVATYVDRAGGDFRQTATSPCRAMGPAWSRAVAATTAARTEPSVDCTAATVRALLPTSVGTPSGAATWAYSRLWFRVDGGAWQQRTWFATRANTGTAAAWWYQAPGATWTQVNGTVDLGVAAGRVELWEQRHELVGGTWTFEWHGGGTCTR